MAENGKIDDLPMASYLKVGCCEHSVTVGLFDKDDVLFAGFQLPLEGVNDFVESLLDKAEEGVSKRLRNAECDGHG
ncbi:MAG: hypothetical protein MI824_15125 [Hyphomicrobiales bacterium]|nr:hypothetical protein [Hyphomicrobiales bacterium]